MAEDWDIKVRSKLCGVCAEPFQDGAACWSRLTYGKEGYERADFCEPCWESRLQSEQRYSAWKGVFAAPPPPAEEPLKKETAETLLRRLMEKRDPADDAAVFILAVMLERKRILVERDVHRSDAGGKTIVYEHRKTGETFAVRDPALRLDQLEHVQTQVVGLLTGGEAAQSEPAGGQPVAGAAADADGRPVPETAVTSAAVAAAAPATEAAPAAPDAPAGA